MVLTPERKTKVNRAVGKLLAGLIRGVEKTSRIVRSPPDQLERLKADHPLILAAWHGQFMMLRLADPGGVDVKAMVARHGDAELIGEAMRQFGVELIRGAGAGDRKKDRGGAHALRASVRALKDGATLVMTADVPTGRPRQAGEGIITIARLSGRPIVPVAVATNRYIALKTRSRLTVNLPFSRLVMVTGHPISVPKDADRDAIEAYRQTLQDSLNEVTQQAFDLAGADSERATPPGTPGVKRPPAKPGTRLKLYRRATSAFRPLAPLLLKIRERQGKEIRNRRGERFGQPTFARPAGPLVWIHAASVGETNAILPLMTALEERRPNLSFVLTTGTVTSAKLANERLGQRAIHQFVPLDSPQYAERFVSHWQPDLAIFTESEIWPNLIFATEEAGVAIALVNARMSDRSFKRWRRNSGFAKPLFGRFSIVLAQNERFARRFADVGANNIISTGNLKIDSPPPHVNTDALSALEKSLANRPRYVCASTHEGEEEIIISAHKLLKREIENVCTIIAPRHPQRGASIANLIKAQGLTVAQRSTGDLPNSNTDIYIADTIGELGTLYKLSPVAFIGGSLVKRGGQNPVEALRHNAAILCGPHQHNFADAYESLAAHKALHVVNSKEELASQLAILLQDETEIQRMRSGAQLAIKKLEGALDKTVSALLPYLPDALGLERAS